MPSRRHKSGFLSAYRLDDAYMLRPDRDKGRPGIYAGYASDGNPILAKVWPRVAALSDKDLEEIWRHELRQLQRLAGYPQAPESIAHLYDAGSDEQGFYLILAAGQRRPLHTVLENAAPQHWLLQPMLPGNRAQIWRNLALLALGLETLHSQGLLHRNIDAWAVLTSGGGEVDFQLTGFEWSMRVVGAEAKLTSMRRHRGDQAQDSFLRDWAMYGMLAADLLGVKRGRLLDTEIPPHEVAEHLSAEEVSLLRNITQVQPEGLLNGELIGARIDQIARKLASQVANRSPKFHLALRLGRDGPLADRIRQSSDNEIEADDVNAQLAFVTDDLNDGPMLIAIKPWKDGDGLRFLLRGRNLHYSLQEFRPQKGGNTTWEFAYCESAEKFVPAQPNIIGYRVLEPSSLEILSLRSAYEQFPRSRGKLRSWEEWKREFLAEAAPQSPQQITHKALTLIQLLEALYAAANVFPVDIVAERSQDPSRPIDENRVRLRSRPDRERDSLARALRLNAPAHRLAQLLTGDRVKPEGWILSESKSLGDKSPSDTEWRFQDIERLHNKPDTYVFTGPEPAPALREAFLIPEGSVGTDAQFRRRLKALGSLKDHDELLRMMTDPRYRIIESHDAFTADASFAKLDDSKQQALKELTSTLPLYLVQGPPGVGKTRLVRDLVRRRFKDEPTSRFLLSAQSNAAIDHLMDELEAVLGKEDAQDAPLIVRCGGKDGQEAPSKFDIRLQSRQLVQQLAGSELAGKLPAKLQKALATLAADAAAPPESGGTKAPPPARSVLGRPVPHALRAFEGAVVRAANVVFATTNSGELERLIEERGQCDWAIVEEAAKATGSELVSPMLLSHRRLMIGDHKQLPPFASDQLIELLENPDAIKEALSVGAEFVGRTLRDATTDEIVDEIEDEENVSEDLPRLCAEALRVLTFFESAIEAEFRRQEHRGSGRPIAKKLTEQHRMHPDIASVVSRCFYDGTLTSHPECIARFQTQQRPFTSTDVTRLPITPIVVIDMPYVQAKIGGGHGERHPRWHNPAEVRAVKECIGLLAAGPAGTPSPTLAVLSPYSQQVHRLDDAIRDLPILRHFSPSSHAGTLCHTVDSFQGGEADFVVVSLVRNNAHSNIQSAFGFLSETRRMNVLLSRARWQLVLVTSLAFLSEIVDAAKGNEAENTIRFVEEMLDELRKGQARGSVSVIPFDQLIERTK